MFRSNLKWKQLCVRISPFSSLLSAGSPKWTSLYKDPSLQQLHVLFQDPVEVVYASLVFWNFPFILQPSVRTKPRCGFVPKIVYQIHPKNQRLNKGHCVWCLNCLFTPVVSRPMADGDSSSTISDSSTENAGTGVVQTSASVSSSHGRESGGAELFGIQLEVSILL